MYILDLQFYTEFAQPLGQASEHIHRAGDTGVIEHVQGLDLRRFCALKPAYAIATVEFHSPILVDLRGCTF